MKYPIDKELHLLTKQKMPAQPELLPAMNMALKMFQCRSDEKTEVKRYKITGFEGYDLPVLVIEPKQVTEKLPCLVLFHGGGFMLGSSGGHYQIAKEYAEMVPCKVVYPEYRVAPKYPFPMPAEDCFCAYKWALKRADELGIDRKKIFIGGDSAGGNLAAVVTMMARDRGLPMPTGTLLVYPVTDRRMITESMRKYTDTPVWDANLSKMMWTAYLGDQMPEKIEYVSPVEAESFAGFPTTYLEVAEFDCLRDEGILFYEKLKEAGVTAQLHEIKGACHGYETAVKSTITRKCMERRIAWIQRLSGLETE